ncbi:1334_t:CDS:2, partial [Cetraspora pellucida]
VKHLLKSINEMKPISTQEFVDMKTTIEGIRAEIFNAKNNLQKIYSIKKEFVSVKEERDKIGEPQHIFKTEYKEIMVKSKIVTDYSNSVCMSCEKVCHEDCGRILSLFCDCFLTLRTCKICGCNLSEFKFEKETKEISDIIRNLEAEDSLRKKMREKTDSYDQTMDKQQSELDKLNCMKNECFLSIIELANKMKSICSRCDLKRELLATIGQLDQLKKHLNHIKISTVRDEANKDIESFLNVFNVLSSNQTKN